MKGARKMAFTGITREDGMMYPNLTVAEEPEPETSLGIYAHMRLRYLKEHRKSDYTSLITSRKMTEHLSEIEKTCQERIERISEQMAKNQGVNEALKKENSLKWAGLMTNIRETVRQNVIREIVYA
jgi:hypothetical protein